MDGWNSLLKRLVFTSIIYWSCLQGDFHMRRFLLEEWTQTETELMRERGLWGPPIGTPLEKWQLDMTEGR